MLCLTALPLRLYSALDGCEGGCGGSAVSCHARLRTCLALLAWASSHDLKNTLPVSRFEEMVCVFYYYC